MINTEIPIHIERYKEEGSSVPRYDIMPLFYPYIAFSGNDVNKVTNRVKRDLRNALKKMGQELNHKQLSMLVNPPLFKSKRSKLELHFRRTTVTIQSALFVSINLDKRKVAFTPLFRDIWFECGKRRVEEVASEVLSKYVKEQEKSEKLSPEHFASKLNSQHWVDFIEMGFAPNSKIPKKEDIDKFFLGFSEKMEGSQELEKVGRNLDDMYPDQLDRVRGCVKEVEKVLAILKDKKSQPTLLLGPHSVGKSAIINEANFQKIKKRGKSWSINNRLYLVSPQRIISGMSYVGQWESRVLAILEECKLRDHLLFIDNLPSLFTTSTGSNSMTIAHVLKPAIESGDLRIIAEATAEEFAVVKEKDRSFAELFNIIPIKEPKPAELMDIMMASSRDCEAKYDVRFKLEVLPVTMELTRRYQKHLANPGKSVSLLEKLSLKYSKSDIQRETALKYFATQCGLSMDILDANKTLEKKEIVQSISSQVIGQKEAVAAMAAAVVRYKARLNDPEKPLAAYLFAGPTGVGKTECAKALAKTLFNNEDRLLRFDMNEFKSADAATLLAGNAWQPEGHLTSAIRTRPFSVILLDEIEKAHPAVFDLLLQVLGEGRLTDSLGRTADFTNSIIIMTSNLGSREASQNLGFSDISDPQTYLSSVKKFFRPEFFNRIDKVIPFESLSKEQISGIAAKMIEKVLSREGLKRRQCILDIDDNVLDFLVDVGYSPKMGARSMKRAVEREVSKPVSAQLVPVAGGQPLILRIKRKDDKLDIKSTPFEITDHAGIFDLEASFPVLKDEMNELLASNEELIGDGIEDWNNMSAAEYHHFNMKDRIEGAKKIWNQLDEMLENEIKPRQNPFSKVSSPMAIIDPDSDISVFFSSGVRNYTRKCLKDNPVFGSEMSHRVKSLVCYSYLLDLLANSEESEAELHFSGLAGKSSEKEAEFLVNFYAKFYEEELHLNVETGKNLVKVSGYAAKELVSLECGIHLFYTEDNRPLPVLVSNGLSEELKVIRAYTPDGGVFDFRSLLLTKSRPENWHFMRFISYAAVFSYEEDANE